MQLPVLLIVDDYPDAIKVFKILFRKKYIVMGAGTLEEARNTLNSVPIDVIIVDFYLPDGVGPQLLPEIPETTLAILVTGSPDRAAEFADAFDAAFPKPYDCFELENEIDHMLKAG